MKLGTKYCALAIIALGYMDSTLTAEEPIIPPSITRVRPAGVTRGSTVVLTVEGRNLAGARAVLFDSPGLSGKVLEVRDLPEQAAELKPFNGTKVPEGIKQEAKLEFTIASDAEGGLHRFRIQTPFGTSRLVVLDVSTLTEIAEIGPNDSLGESQQVKLPATLVGVIGQPGDIDRFRFAGQAGQQMVFQVVAATLGSQLLPILTLYDSAGHELSRAGEFSRLADPVLTFKLPVDGNYTLSISDLRLAGSPDHFYRIHAGALPYVSEVFPLGVRAGQPAEVKVKGSNLGDVQSVTLRAPASGEYWRPFDIRVETAQGESLNKVWLAEGEEPEILETEPNNDPGHAQSITVPVTINGHISGGREDTPDVDYFRFAAKGGQHLVIEVAAARLGSPLDSVVEALDANGREIPRAIIRSVLEHTLTLPAGPKQQGFYVPERAGFRTNDYLMIGSEIVQITTVPDEPDMNLLLKSYGGERIGMLNTATAAHDVGTPVYKVQILEPAKEFLPNGLPALTLTYRNDDGGPGYGADSRLDFIVPRDGEYLVRIGDVRGLQGENFAYRLIVHEANPDFALNADPANPNIPSGGRIPLTVSADRRLGYEGPIEVQVKGLPQGITAGPAFIPAGQDSTVVTLTAAADASLENILAAPFEVLGRGQAQGRGLVRRADEKLPAVAVTLPPDLVITAEPKEVVLEAGNKSAVALHVDRKKGFQGQVYCTILNLPPGVRVADIGANGVVIPEGESTRKAVLVADDWTGNMEQPIYVSGSVQNGVVTQNVSAPQILSAPVMLKLRSKQVDRTTAVLTRH